MDNFRSVFIEKNSAKIVNVITTNPSEWLKRRRLDTPNAGEGVELWNSHTLLLECKMVQSTLKNVFYKGKHLVIRQ